MHTPDFNASPINSIPPVVLMFFLPFAGIELIFQAGEAGFMGPNAIGWRLEYARQFGFSGPIQDWMLANQTVRWDYATRYLTYSFVHHSFTHALFASVFMLALGKFVAEIMEPWAVAAVFFISAIVGAFSYGLILDEQVLLIGGYVGVYGLIGAFTFILFAGLSDRGRSGLQAFSLIGMFMVFQAVWKIVAGGNNQWLAEIVGFVTGFGLTIFLTPGGLVRFRNVVSSLRRN